MMFLNCCLFAHDVRNKYNITIINSALQNWKKIGW